MLPLIRTLRPLIALVIAAQLSLAAWYWLGRPVAITEAASSAPLNCLSYTPFRHDESPFQLGVEKNFTPARIEEDLRLLAPHTSCIRLYGALGMEQIPPIAQQLGLQILQGAWVSADTAATRREIEALVTLANAYPQTIRAVLVGNEALLRQEIAPQRLAELIREVKERVPQPVSYADVWEFQLRHAQVTEASDFVTIHILPYWEDDPVAIDNAIDHVRRIHQQVTERLPGKAILIGETGWPSVGRMREGALPSRINEARFLRGFIAAAQAEGWDYNRIEAFDQPWKRQLEGAVGGYWGIFDTGRHDKQLLSGAVSNHPAWLLLATLALALGTAIILLLRLTPLLAPLVAVVAVGWTLQLEQLWLVSRTPLETAGGLLLLACVLGASLAALARLAGRPFRGPLEPRLALLLGSVAAILSLWLLFDARYRDFFTAGFLPPALLMFLLLRSPSPVLGRGDEELAIGSVLVGSALLIAYNETLLNHQALGWSLATLLLGGALLWRGVRGKKA
ncbi:MAG TPA: beta (1-6) glucans synthase [Gammaproteobacteria bacterium]